VPALGDAFDVYFRAGERNLELLRRHSGTAPATPSRWDYAVVSLALLVVLGVIALPLVVGIAVVHTMLKLFGG
jgi:hypothetical protein